MSIDVAPAARESSAATRLQILATEHWSLLATRSLTYNEALSRVTIFLAILSGAVIALALVVQADGFGPTTISIAIPVLCVVHRASCGRRFELVATPCDRRRGCPTWSQRV